jgi:hypothetical protein
MSAERIERFIEGQAFLQWYDVASRTEYTELQRLLSGVHSIMRVKLAQAGEGGGCTPTPFHYIYHHQ